jgi:hypothetical protein
MSGAAEVKDLAYYENRPSELGELSVDQIEALYASGSGDERGADEGADTSSGLFDDQVDNGESRDESTAPASDATPAETDDKADGVLAKDGKHVLPFTVLEGARRRAAELEEIVRQQTEYIASLSQQAGKSPDPEQQAQQASDSPLSDMDIDDETIAAYEEELPALAKVLRQARANQQVIQQLTEQVADLSTRDERKAQQETANKSRGEVQDAIDAVPAIAHLQASDPEAWAEVVALDNSMKDLPKFKALSLKDRFEKVAAAYQAVNGPIKLPAAEPSQKDMTKEADRVIAASAGRTRPASLTDLPGGATPPVDERAAFETTSTAELGASFERMNDEQQQAYLARLGLL